MNAHSRNGFIGILTAALVAICLLPSAGLAAEKPQLGGITGRVFLDENADTEFRECDCDCGMEHIPVRLYQGSCGGLITRTATTNAEGYFHFDGLEPGEYCLMPVPKFICEGYQPTKSITQKVRVKPGKTVEAEWFGFDHFLDVKD